MQTIYLHKSVYRLRGIDETEYPPEVWQKLHSIESYEKLLAQDCAKDAIFEALKVSRATLYRWNKQYKKFGLAGLGQSKSMVAVSSDASLRWPVSDLKSRYGCCRLDRQNIMGTLSAAMAQLNTNSMNNMMDPILSR